MSWARAARWSSTLSTRSRSSVREGPRSGQTWTVCDIVPSKRGHSVTFSATNGPRFPSGASQTAHASRWARHKLPTLLAVRSTNCLAHRGKTSSGAGSSWHRSMAPGSRSGKKCWSQRSKSLGQAPTAAVERRLAGQPRRPCLRCGGLLGLGTGRLGYAVLRCRPGRRPSPWTGEQEGGSGENGRVVEWQTRWTQNGF